MKRLLFALLMVLLPLSTMALDKNMAVKSNNTDAYLKYVAPSSLSWLNDASKGGNAPTIQGYKAIDRPHDALFSFYSQTTPFVYEPTSGVLATIQNLRESDQTDNIDNGTLYIMTSTNLGKNWSSKRQLWKQNGELAVWPSLAVINLDKSKDPSKLTYFAFSPVAKYQGPNNWPFDGGVFAYINATESYSENYFGPNTTLQRWISTRMMGVTGDGEGFIYNLGMLANTTGQQYGAYGFMGNYVDKTGFEPTFIGMPEKWDFNVFRKSTDLNRSYNTSPEFDTDADGAVYMAVNNIFAADEQHRVPGVSKSADYGQTWSNFDMMPASYFTDFITSVNGQADIDMTGPTTYQGNAFIVTGPDEYSFVMRAWTSSDGKQYDGFYIIEVYKKGGFWGIRPITEYQGLPLPMVLQNEGADYATNFKDSLQLNQNGNELQIAKTADNSAILIKWVQAVDRPLVLNPPFVYKGKDADGNDANIQVDTLYSTDVFTTYRKLGEDTWSQPVNITNDDLYNKCTVIPRIIPDLQNVPMLSLQTVKVANTQNPRYPYSDYIQQLIIDAWFPQDVMFTSFNATGETSVETKPEQLSFNLNDVYPNPAQGTVELSFNLERASATKLVVTNSLGQTVKVFESTKLDAGLHTAVLNTENLAAGVYYYTLTTGNQSQTKILNIVK